MKNKKLMFMFHKYHIRHPLSDIGHLVSGIILILFLNSSLVFADEITKVGSTSANFLQMEIGARAIAMGGAYVGLADDASALFWNPAGLGLTQTGRVHYQILNLYAGIKHHFGGMVYHPGRSSSIGVQVNYLDVGEMEVTTIEEPEGTGENFNVTNLAVGLSFALRLTDRVFVGVSAKYIQEKIWLESAAGIAIDLGTIYNIESKGVRVGMALTNLGPDMGINDGPHLHFYKEKPANFPGSPQPDSRYATKKFPLPLTFSLGVSANIIGQQAILAENERNRITVSVTSNDGFDAPFRTNWGVEYSWQESFALRGGYHQGYDTAGLTFGFGLNLQKYTRLNLLIDYAWSDYRDLGNINLWSLEFQL